MDNDTHCSGTTSANASIASRGYPVLALLIWLLSVGGCATLRPDFEKPSVTVTSFNPLPASSLAPSFEIGLRVVNPNTVSLNLRGISYKLALNGFDVVEGAANNLPAVPAHGEATFKVDVTVGMIEGMRFVSDLLRNKHGQVEYRIQANLDVGAMIPTIRIEKTGSYVP
ncbi:MAG: LEA type 2 family protein [Gallionella sp.]